MAAEVADLLDRSRQTLSKALGALDLGCDKVIEKLTTDTEYDKNTGSHLAWVASKVAEVMSALRQLEKHDRLMAKTPEQRFALVCAFVRDLGAPQRAQIAQLLASLEGERKVLA
jgi:hypothetical protein